MALDFYREGYEAGRSAAAISEKEIRAAGRPGVAEMAGCKIGLRRSRPEAPWHVQHSKSWAVGFFDGYLDRADIVLAREA